MRSINVSPRAPAARRIGIAVLAAAILLAAFLAVRFISDRGIPGKTEEERLTYLRSLGWEPCCGCVKEKTILLPEEFPEVLINYNKLQLQQGFDLSKLAGKEIRMYVYELSNHPDDPEALCSLYVYRGKIVGGDVHSPRVDGFMGPLTAGQAAENKQENG